METNIELLKLMRQAIKQGDINAVKEMVKKNAGLLEAVTPLGSWLHIAAECGNSVMVSYFIDAGLDVNTNGGLAEANPLKAAANNGHLDVVNILYQNGAQFETEEATKTPCLVQYMEIILTWFAFWWKMALTLPSSIKLET